VNLERTRQFVARIGEREDEILRRRFQKQQAQKARIQREKEREKADLRRYIPPLPCLSSHHTSHHLTSSPPSWSTTFFSFSRKELQEINSVLRRAGVGPLAPGSNEEAAALLRNALLQADAHRRSGSKEPLKLSVSLGEEEEYPDEVRFVTGFPFCSDWLRSFGRFWLCGVVIGCQARRGGLEAAVLQAQVRN
jgi:hypothetical protein